MRRCSRCGGFYDGEHMCGLDQVVAALPAQRQEKIERRAAELSEQAGPVRYKRDPEKWRAYMRDYMRRRRGRAHPV